MRPEEGPSVEAGKAMPSGAIVLFFFATARTFLASAKTLCYVASTANVSRESVQLFMDHLIHRAPSVGGVIKKMLAINPDLGATQIIEFIKQSTVQQGSQGEFAEAERIDEERALRLARATVAPSRGKLSLVPNPRA
jgi:hypothetical protein